MKKSLPTKGVAMRENTIIDDLDRLAAACKSLGLELVRGQKSFRWSGLHPIVPLPEEFPGMSLGECHHAIRIPGEPDAFEVGVVEAKDGRFGFIFDSWRGGIGLIDRVGKDCEDLTEAYAVARG